MSKNPAWDEDCLRWHGTILRGPDRHWCWDWDGLPIDATCREYQGCTCEKTFLGKIVGNIKGRWWRRFERQLTAEEIEELLSSKENP